MTLHLICERDVGLFSLIQQVLAHLPWAESERRTPVALFGRRCCYWVEEGHEGASSVWEYYFEPLDADRPAASLDGELLSDLGRRFPDPRDVGLWLRPDVWASSHFGDHPRLRGKTLRIPYGWDDPDAQTRLQAARLFRTYVRPRPYLAAKVESFHERHMAGRTVLGVQIRGTDAVSSREDRAHRKDSLVLANFEHEIGRRLEATPDAFVFVATDDQRSLDAMRRAFGARVLALDGHRHASGEVAGRGPTGGLMPAYITHDRALAARNGEEAVTEFLLLARCGCLIHNGSSLARTVLLHAPELPHVNTHRGSRFLAHLKTFSFRKVRRNVRRVLRRLRSSFPEGAP